MSLTNVTFPEEDERDLKAAIRYYGYETLNQFFRSAGHVLIKHYVRKDPLSFPIRFVTAAKLVEKAK